MQTVILQLREHISQPACRWAALGRCIAALAFMISAFSAVTFAQAAYNGLRVDKIDIVLDGGKANEPASETYRGMIRGVVEAAYSVTKVHDAIRAVYATRKIASVVVTATPSGTDAVDLRFDLRRKPEAEKVSVVILPDSKSGITEQELLFKLNILDPGATITEQSLQNNADLILDYLRDKGFYRSQVTFTQKPLERENSVGVEFRVTPGEQATVDTFQISIQGLEPPIPADAVKLRPGKAFSREALAKDVETIRGRLQKQDFIAPELSEPRVTYDSDKNSIAISLEGRVGPTVKINAESEDEKVGEGTLDRILPFKREGILDYAAIVEGQRRLETYFQENGYFFAEATPVCSVIPQLSIDGGDLLANETEFLCSNLSSYDLQGRTVTVNYRVDAKRKLRLVSLRIRGTNELPIEELRTVLESQEANFLGVIPLFGYGRGYTSQNILDRDAATVRSLMNELGFREATVRVIQGVSPEGEDLIITFQVEEGRPSMVEGVSITGNTAFSDDVLLSKIPDLVNMRFSRAKVRNAVRALSEFYSNEGYYDARVSSSIDENSIPADDGARYVKVAFRIENEGRRVVIGRVLIEGNVKTKQSAILRASNIKPGEYLKAADVYGTEQNLYSTDAFDRVDIKPEPAGDAPSGDRVSDVIISVSEQAPRVMTYGGGYSTDLGLNGFFDIRHVNLLGNLWQGGARIRWSQRQQLVQFDFVNPRFMRDGGKRFAPLTVSAQYQRDSTVTRFFRSAFDKGTFGIVQRIDANGNPIDQFGQPTGDPTINRLTLSAETSKTLSRKKRSIIFGRYRFEDVRLSNIDSLLVKDLLAPDSNIRTSGFGVTYVRDTRENCSIKYSVLELIAKGEPGPKCRYSASDPTRGNYITAEYNVSLPFLGANVGYHKFQASYNVYYTFPKLRNITLAGRAILGLASVFSNRNRYDNSQYPGLEGILPISERFFAGGANTLRGFAYEEAGPRVVVIPQGTFLNSKREPVTLDPFTVPIGGNALAVVNLEARIPVSNSFRLVPFYDGGNVFKSVSDIFKPPAVAPNDVFGNNLRTLWSHTVGIGLRLKTPIGGEFGVDYGRLLNPPRFLIPQQSGPNAIFQLRQDQIHFRFSQAF